MCISSVTLSKTFCICCTHLTRSADEKQNPEITTDFNVTTGNFILDEKRGSEGEAKTRTYGKFTRENHGLKVGFIKANEMAKRGNM